MAITKEHNGKVVSFQLYPAGIITDDFTNVKVVGTTTYEGAAAYISPPRLHAMVFATLPEGSINDYRLYEYALIMKPNGKITAIGIPWIKANTLVVVGSVELQVTIRNKSVEDVDNLRRVLMENNFVDFTINAAGINA